MIPAREGSRSLRRCGEASAYSRIRPGSAHVWNWLWSIAHWLGGRLGARLDQKHGTGGRI